MTFTLIVSDRKEGELTLFRCLVELPLRWVGSHQKAQNSVWRIPELLTIDSDWEVSMTLLHDAWDDMISVLS